jgi:hypothetical protein
MWYGFWNLNIKKNDEINKNNSYNLNDCGNDSGFCTVENKQ